MRCCILIVCPWFITWPIRFWVDSHLLAMYHCTKVMNFPAKGSRNIEGDNILFRTSSLTLPWTLTMWPGVIYSRSIKFAHFQAKVSRDIEWTKCFQRPAVWPWPLTMWPQNQRGHLLHMDIHCTKFGNFQAKGGQKILSRQGLVSYRHTNWPTGPFFQ